MAASEYAYEGRSDWSKFCQCNQILVNREEVLDRFKENLIVYLNNLTKNDTTWNDNEYEYAMKVKDDLEEKKTTKKIKRRGDCGEDKFKKVKRNK